MDHLAEEEEEEVEEVEEVEQVEEVEEVEQGVEEVGKLVGRENHCRMFNETRNDRLFVC